MTLVSLERHQSHDHDLYLAAGHGVEHDRLLLIRELVNYLSRGGPGRVACPIIPAQGRVGLCGRNASAVARGCLLATPFAVIAGGPPHRPCPRHRKPRAANPGSQTSRRSSSGSAHRTAAHLSGTHPPGIHRAAARRRAGVHPAGALRTGARPAGTRLAGACPIGTRPAGTRRVGDGRGRRCPAATGTGPRPGPGTHAGRFGPGRGKRPANPGHSHRRPTGARPSRASHWSHCPGRAGRLGPAG